jgi:hypothetical protein
VCHDKALIFCKYFHAGTGKICRRPLLAEISAARRVIA